MRAILALARDMADLIADDREADGAARREPRLQHSGPKRAHDRVDARGSQSYLGSQGLVASSSVAAVATK